MKFLAFAFAGTALTLFAQAPNANGGSSTSGFALPVLGFVSGQSPVQLQPIIGIPGSARLGNPLSLPKTVTQIRIAPGHAYALVQQGPGHPLSLVSLRGISETQTLTLTPIPGAIAQADLLAFSPMGVSIAIYSRQMNRLQVLTGLPKSPRVLLDVPDFATTFTPQKLAVSDDGQAVLIADETGSVYSLSHNGAPVPVYDSPELSDLAFVAQSRDAIVCDRSLNTALFLHDASTAPVPLVPATNDRCQPEAAASTADGKTILLACAAQRAVLSIDRTSGLTHLYKVSSSPSTLDRLGVRDVFLMSPAESGTYWLFVWGPEAPSTFFVAAPYSASQGSGN